MIANGSELLLLIKQLRNVVGSVVLPVLGAVPDGAIVLFSGLRENAQEEVAIGVGALAGSTILLLTLPWFSAIYAGRVKIRADGETNYHHSPRLWPPGFKDPLLTGVEPYAVVRDSGRFMLVTSISYVIIQGMALMSGSHKPAQQTAESVQATAEKEHSTAILVLCVCTALFTYYIWTQFFPSKEKEAVRDSRVEKITIRAIEEKSITLTAAFDELGKLTTSNETTELLENRKRLKAVLKVFFNEYDRDNSGFIEQPELSHLMSDLGERMSETDVKNFLFWMDRSKDGVISYEEFCDAIPKYIRHRVNQEPLSPAPLVPIPSMGLEESGGPSQPFETSNSGPKTTVVGEDDDEEEEVPEDLRDGDPATEQRRILMRSFGMMFLGTALVLVFSDPTVAVMQDMAERLNISGFYISFILAPVASNFSEVVAAYSYAKKKTKKTITISFTTLLGAAILNNTFVLGIFMMLIIMKGLAWQFTAETLAILVVEVVLGLMSQKKVHTLRDGYIVLSLFPFSLFLVFFLQNIMKWD